MSDAFDDYMTEIVGPTIADFEANPVSRRHAFLACVATFHAFDYLLERPAPYRRKFRQESGAFALVDRVAHAFKHVTAGHPDGPDNQPLAARDVISRPPGILDSFTLDLSLLDDTIGGVTINEERDVDLLQTVKEAAAFLRNKAMDSATVAASLPSVGSPRDA